MSLITLPPHPVHSRRAIALGVVGAIIIGVLTATQSRVNGELGRSLADGYLAAVISFGSGLVILLVALMVWAPGRRGLGAAFGSVRAGTTPWWYLCGGAGGALFVLAQGITGAVLGVALFTVAVVCGQTISGLVIDRNGIGHTPPAAITITRLVGSGLALAAVAVAVSAGFGGNIPAWMLLLPFAAGLAVAVQQAVNGQVRRIAGSALTATFMNFLVGTTVLLVACLIHEAIVGPPERLPSNPLLYLGGIIGGGLHRRGSDRCARHRRVAARARISGRPVGDVTPARPGCAGIRPGGRRIHRRWHAAHARSRGDRRGAVTTMGTEADQSALRCCSAGNIVRSPGFSPPSRPPT